MSSDKKSAAKIFVGGLSFSTTDATLKSFFSKYGEVIEAIVMKDATTKRSRGFGFIVFATASAVDRVLSERDLRVDGRKVDAKRAVPRGDDGLYGNEDLPPPETPKLRSASGGSGSSLSVGKPPSATSAAHASGPTSPLHSSSPHSSKHSVNTIHGTASALSHRKIFAGGLHYGTDEDGLRRYFGQFGKISAAQVMYNRETCKSRGFGFVIFEDEASVDRVLANRMHVIDEKTVEVKRAVPKSDSSPVPPDGLSIASSKASVRSDGGSVHDATGPDAADDALSTTSSASGRPVTVGSGGASNSATKPVVAPKPFVPAWGPNRGSILEKLRQPPQDPIPEDSPVVTAAPPIVPPQPLRTPAASANNDRAPSGKPPTTPSAGERSASVGSVGSAGIAAPSPIKAAVPSGQSSSWAGKVKGGSGGGSGGVGNMTPPLSTAAPSHTSPSPASTSVAARSHGATSDTQPPPSQPLPAMRKHSRSSSIVLSSCAASVGSSPADADSDAFGTTADGEDDEGFGETDDFADNPFSVDDFESRGRFDSALGSIDDEIITDDRRSRSGSDAVSSVSSAAAFGSFRVPQSSASVSSLGGTAVDNSAAVPAPSSKSVSRPPPSPIVRKPSTDATASVSSRLSFSSTLGTAAGAGPSSPFASGLSLTTEVLGSVMSTDVDDSSHITTQHSALGTISLGQPMQSSTPKRPVGASFADSLPSLGGAGVGSPASFAMSQFSSDGGSHPFGSSSLLDSLRDVMGESSPSITSTLDTKWQFTQDDATAASVAHGSILGLNFHPTQAELDNFDIGQALAAGLIADEASDKDDGSVKHNTAPQYDNGPSFLSGQRSKTPTSTASAFSGVAPATPAEAAAHMAQSSSPVGLRKYVSAPEFVMGSSSSVGPQSVDDFPGTPVAPKSPPSSRRPLNPNAIVWSAHTRNLSAAMMESSMPREGAGSGSTASAPSMSPFPPAGPGGAYSTGTPLFYPGVGYAPPSMHGLMQMGLQEGPVMPMAFSAPAPHMLPFMPPPGPGYGGGGMYGASPMFGSGMLGDSVMMGLHHGGGGPFFDAHTGMYRPSPLWMPPPQQQGDDPSLSNGSGSGSAGSGRLSVSGLSRMPPR